jgi:hypothetical protein
MVKIKAPKKNPLRIGLKSEKKLQTSFYSFLYDKHFDWAIILAAFFATLPYIQSKFYFILILKTLIFSTIVYFCIRYIITWKELQDYYKIYNHTIKKTKALIDKKIMKERELKAFNEFSKNFITELEDLGNSFKDNNENLTFKEFIERYPEKGKSLENVLNKDKKVTRSTFGLTLGVMTVMIHMRGIPKNELKNYRRIQSILLLIFIFFCVYIIEMSFL